jgi:hypothetical protein
MSTDVQHTCRPKLNRSTRTIVSIAVTTAKETILWIAKGFAFLAAVVTFSAGVAVISSTAAGAVLALFLILGVVAVTPRKDRNYYFPPQ